MQSIENEGTTNNDNSSLNASSEEFASLRELIKSDPEYLNRQDSRLGSTQLFSSVMSNNYKKTEFLLHLGADPNIPNNLGETPLHIAADNFEYDTVKLLLSHGADPKNANLEGETPLHNATYRGDAKTVNILLQNYADPNSLNFQLGQSPLHIAAENGHLEIIKLLLSHGANPDIKDKQGNTPSSLAKIQKIQQILDDWSENVEYDANTGLCAIREARSSEEDISSLPSLQCQSSLASIAMSPTNKVYSSPPTPFSKYLKSCGTADTTLGANQKSISQPGSREISILVKENDKLYEFLINIKLDIYFSNLVNAGFDDFDSLINQMSTPLPLTAEMLKNIGISKPGHQKRLLFMLEKAKNSPEEFLNNSYVNESIIIESTFWKCCIFPKIEHNDLTLKEILESLGLGNLYEKFYEAGYDELEFLVEQMKSKFIINEKLLKDEIGIEGVKDRKKIMGKLKSLSKQAKKSEMQQSSTTCRMF
ncbi:unnamed protein product [Blepharisma stoltei]|uniref:NAD(+) ADP-ribosyltransferase n=1 Tax=Blepharisma stoltei TaxID=1481888 RepID=A0AAU9JZ12_9CILI|nr:unnamed protein product [Blepharisma stoltei]